MVNLDHSRAIAPMDCKGLSLMELLKWRSFDGWLHVMVHVQQDDGTVESAGVFEGLIPSIPIDSQPRPIRRIPPQQIPPQALQSIIPELP